MRKCWFALIVVLTAAVSGVAQQAQTSDVPDKADVMKFFDLMQARQQMVMVLDGMAKQMKAGAEEGFKQKVPDATPAQIAKLDKMVDTIVGSMPVDEMVEAMIPIYQKHLTRSDLAAITAFYASPSGQKFLKEMPAIMSEAMAVGGDIGRKAAAAKSAEIDRQTEELVKESENSKSKL